MTDRKREQNQISEVQTFDRRDQIEPEHCKTKTLEA